MRVLAQRVSEAKVEIDGKIFGQIAKGMLLYVCLEKGDSLDSLEIAADKIAKLRFFEDEKGKMNLNFSQAGGKILSVSQFTLSWRGEKGNRPSFERSMPPNEAKEMYGLFNAKLESKGLAVETGKFGADMKVASVNDGPVTFLLSF